jgi:transposase
MGTYVRVTMRCMDRASLEQLLGQWLSLAEIGRRFGRHEATVSYWVKKHGLEAANHDKHAARGGIAREELERLVEARMSIAQIAEAVGRSKPTVRHWLIRVRIEDARRSWKAPAWPDQGGKAGWACDGDDALHLPWGDRVLPYWARLLPLQAVSIGGRGSEAQEGQGHPGRGGRRRLLHMRIRPQHACSALPSRRPIAEAARDQRQGSRDRSREAAGRGAQVRASML